MPGLRFGERLIVFVGIGVCAGFDWFKRRVTKWKQPVYTPKHAAAAVERFTPPVPRIVPAESLRWGTPMTYSEYSARLRAYEAAGRFGAGVGTLRDDLDNKHDAVKTAMTSMETDLNAYLAADKTETPERTKGYNENEPIDFFPPGTFHSNTPPTEGPTPANQDWDF